MLYSVERTSLNSKLHSVEQIGAAVIRFVSASTKIYNFPFFFLIGVFSSWIPRHYFPSLLPFYCFQISPGKLTVLLHFFLKVGLSSFLR